MGENKMQEEYSYETPELVEYGTIEEWTKQTIDLSIVIGDSPRIG